MKEMNGDPKETETMKRDRTGTTQPAGVITTTDLTTVHNKETTTGRSIMKGQADMIVIQAAIVGRGETTTEDPQVGEITIAHRKEAADTITGSNILPIVRESNTIRTIALWTKEVLL